MSFRVSYSALDGFVVISRCKYTTVTLGSAKLAREKRENTEKKQEIARKTRKIKKKQEKKFREKGKLVTQNN